MSEKKSLVIVESPAKAKTINQYLGREYKVLSTMGHIRDLPERSYGVKIEPNGKFIPQYRIIRSRLKQVNLLKAESRKADMIYLAADPDREGEAICWHVQQVLDGSGNKIKRIEFNEITRHAITEAIKNPREIDINLVNAQQARRILDRIVGYELSPVLWRKIKRGLSAGRVQSVALKLIVEREREIQNFVPKEYWTIKVKFEFDGKVFEAQLVEPKIKDEQHVREILEKIKADKFRVTAVEQGERKQTPPPPFITSTLQQEASKQYGFSSKRTMQIAQRLYEGVKIDDEGHIKGVITYMRTDSTRVAKEAVFAVRNLIKDKFGEEFLSPRVRVYRKKSAQDAHEAIRPTDLKLTPEKLSKFLTKDEYKLYTLIFNRFLMHQMSDAVYQTRKLVIEGNDLKFEAAGEENTFPGFLKLSKIPKSTIPPLVGKGQSLVVSDIDAKKNYTKPPSRYKEHTLIKELESKGIGRPSTYATILSTIQDRGYVIKKKGFFYPTSIGFVVSDFLNQWFNSIINEKFTSEMEASLDEIAAGRIDWQKMLKEFYDKFKPLILEAKTKSERVKNLSNARETEEKCEKCGATMVLREGRYGHFLACSNYPNCRNIKNISLKEDGTFEIIEKKSIETDIPCPLCGKGVLVERTNRKGESFYGCSRYPACRFTMPKKRRVQKCPECGFELMYYEERKKVWICPKCGKSYEKVK